MTAKKLMRPALPLFLGVVCGMASHGMTDPKFWILLVIGSACAVISERAK